VKFTNKFEEINKENLDKFYNIRIENGINEFQKNYMIL
jgi:ribosome biogenesis protein Tsr3